MERSSRRSLEPRAAHWAGYAHPRDALPLGKVSELADELRRTRRPRRSASSPACSNSLRLAPWNGAGARRCACGRSSRARDEDRGPSLAGAAAGESARPGMELIAEDWIAAIVETVAIADESGDDALRVGIRTAGSLQHVASGAFDEAERVLDEALDRRRRSQHGIGDRDRMPLRLRGSFQGCGRAGAGTLRRGRRALRLSASDRGRAGRSKTESWTRGQEGFPRGGAR